MELFFTADLHLGHVRLAEQWRALLGGTVDDHDAEVITRWNSVVESQDHVFILGDLAMGDIRKSLDRVKMLNGHKHLVPGNHDRVWPHYRNEQYALDWAPAYEDAGVEILPTVGVVQLNMLGGKVGLCHFPPMNAEDVSRHGSRFDKYRPVHTVGLTVVLHGHTHSAKKVSGPKSINVGLDAWGFAPANVKGIQAEMKKWVFTP